MAPQIFQKAFIKNYKKTYKIDMRYKFIKIIKKEINKEKPNKKNDLITF